MRVNPTNLKRMTTFTNYIYSKAAASRILGKKVISVAVEGDRVKCQLWDTTFRTTTTARFKEHFAERRREQGKKLEPKRNFFTCDWYVNGYTVDVKPDRLDCCCEDWKTQKRIGINRPTCKHCYAVLYKMGYGKLSEYLEERSSSNKATNQTDEDSHQISSSLAPELPKINRFVWRWESYAADRAVVIGELIVPCRDGNVTVESCGSSELEGKSQADPICTAEQQAFKRCCKRLGLALHLDE